MSGLSKASGWLLVSLVGAVQCGGSALAQSGPLEGTIRRFECGDNCYLTVVDKANKAHTGLCTAPECQAWNEEAAMPARYRGRRVAVTLGRANQVDGDGNVMGRMTAFSRIRFLD